MDVLRTCIKLSLIFFIYSCSGTKDTVTEVIMLRSDTYISKSSSSNHSGKSYLLLAKNSSDESRILLRLPTNEYDDSDGFFDKCFEDSTLCSIFFLPVYIAVKIVSDCSGDGGLAPDDLISAILILNTNDGSSIAAGNLNLNALTKPWWHTATWKMAHPFSTKGKWSQKGGDIDSSKSFETNCTNLSSGSCASGEIKFELTSFFKDHLTGGSNHYGLIVSPNTNLSSSKIYSVQASSVYSPRIEATYTCAGSFVPREKTFYFGNNPE